MNPKLGVVLILALFGCVRMEHVKEIKVGGEAYGATEAESARYRRYSELAVRIAERAGAGDPDARADHLCENLKRSVRALQQQPAGADAELVNPNGLQVRTAQELLELQAAEPCRAAAAARVAQARRVADAAEAERLRRDQAERAEREDEERRRAEEEEIRRAEEREAALVACRAEWKRVDQAMTGSFEALVASTMAPGQGYDTMGEHFGDCFADCNEHARDNPGERTNEFAEMRCRGAQAACRRKAIGRRFASVLLITPSRFDVKRRAFPIQLPTHVGSPVWMTSACTDEFARDAVANWFTESVPTGADHHLGSSDPGFEGIRRRTVMLHVPDLDLAESIRRDGRVAVHLVFETKGLWTRRLSSRMGRALSRLMANHLRQGGYGRLARELDGAMVGAEETGGFTVRVLGIQVRTLHDGTVLHSEPRSVVHRLSEFGMEYPCDPPPFSDFALYTDALTAASGMDERRRLSFVPREDERLVRNLWGEWVARPTEDAQGVRSRAAAVFEMHRKESCYGGDAW